MPSFAMYFLTYEFLQDSMKREDGTFGPAGSRLIQYLRKAQIVLIWYLETLLAGGCAGVAGWGVAIPMDTAKNRHQAQLERTSSLCTVRKIIQTDGISGFYRGAWPILLRAFPANAAAFLGYETAVTLISNLWEILVNNKFIYIS